MHHKGKIQCYPKEVDAAIEIPMTFDVGRAFLPDPEAGDKESENLRRTPMIFGWGRGRRSSGRRGHRGFGRCSRCRGGRGGGEGSRGRVVKTVPATRPTTVDTTGRETEW